jgi:hypothetical protein
MDFYYKTREMRNHCKLLIILLLLSMRPLKKYSKSRLIFYLCKRKRLPILRKDLMDLEKKSKNSERTSWKLFLSIIMETTHSI